MKLSTVLMKAIIISEVFLVALYKAKDWYPAFPIEGFFPFMAIALGICIIGIPIAGLALLFDE